MVASTIQLYDVRNHDHFKDDQMYIGPLALTTWSHTPEYCFVVKVGLLKCGQSRPFEERHFLLALGYGIAHASDRVSLIQPMASLHEAPLHYPTHQMASTRLLEDYPEHQRVTRHSQMRHPRVLMYFMMYLKSRRVAAPQRVSERKFRFGACSA